MKKKEKRQFKTQLDKKDFIKFIILFAVVLGTLALSIYMLPWIISLKDEAGRQAFKEYIENQGAAGVFILLGIQILQVVVAIIPGEPIEVISGLLYGAGYGYLICTVGMLIGTVTVFYAVKLLGLNFINKIISPEKLEKFKFLHNAKQLKVITFILFFIPGTPKDMLTYFMPLTKINPLTFFVIVTLARIPSILSSTYAGETIGDGDWLKTLVIFALIGAIGILGIILNDKFMKKYSDKKKAKQQ